VTELCHFLVDTGKSSSLLAASSASLHNFFCQKDTLADVERPKIRPKKHFFEKLVDP
jgi:hypothetical protein